MANRISTILDLDDRGFKSTLKGIGTSVGQADGMLGKFKAGAKGAFDGLKQYSGEAALAAGAALVAFGVKAVGAFTGVAKAALDLGTATGLSIEDASRWIAVADDMGVSAEALQSGIGKIAKTLDDTKWEKFGVATRDAGGNARSTNDILLDTFDKLGKITNETERAAQGNLLFGKGYASLSPLIGKSREEMEKYLGSVEKGQVVTGKEAEKAEKFRLAQDKLNDAIKEVTLSVGQMVAGLSPMIERTADTVTTLVGLAEKAENAAEAIGGLGTVLDIVASGNPVKIFNDLKDAAGSFTSYLDMSLTDAMQLFDDMDISVERQTELIEEWHKANDGAAGSSDDLTKIVRTEEQALQDLAVGTDVAAAAAKGKEEADKNLKSGMENLTKAIIDEYNAQLHANQAAIDALGGQGDLEQSIRDVASGYYDLTLKIIENAKTQKDSKVDDAEKAQSQRDLQTATHNQAAEVLALAEQYAAEKGAVKGSKEQQDLMRDALIMNKAQYPELAAEIQKYINKLNAIPSAVFTEVNVHSTNTLGPKVALAEGGIVKATSGGTLAVIGEGVHDEAVIPLGPGNTVGQLPGSNGSNGSNGNGGGMTVNVTVNAGLGTNGKDVGLQIAEVLRKTQRQYGALGLT